MQFSTSPSVVPPHPPAFAPCEYQPACPGCPRFGDEVVAPEAVARLERLCADVSAPAPRFVHGPGLLHRHRARLAVRGSAAHPEIGIFERGSHRVAAIPYCGVHAPEINAAVQRVQAAMIRAGVAPYDERSGQGLLRYVQVVVERRSRLVQLTLVGNTASAAALSPLFAELMRSGPDHWLHSLHFNRQEGSTNTILGHRFERIWGAEYVVERFGEADVFFPPGAFGQANLPLFDDIVRTVHDWARDCPRVLELYSGVGALGLGLLARGQHVGFNEISPHGLQGLRRGLGNLPAGGASDVWPGTADDVVESSAFEQPWDCAIVDPPRKGLGPRVLARLAAAGPPQLFYVSCGLAAFENDVRVLAPSYALKECVGFALFPYTEHVETVARLQRRSAP